MTPGWAWVKGATKSRYCLSVTGPENSTCQTRAAPPAAAGLAADADGAALLAAVLLVIALPVAAVLVTALFVAALLVVARLTEPVCVVGAALLTAALVATAAFEVVPVPLVAGAPQAASATVPIAPATALSRRRRLQIPA